MSLTEMAQQFIVSALCVGLFVGASLAVIGLWVTGAAGHLLREREPAAKPLTFVTRGMSEGKRPAKITGR